MQVHIDLDFLLQEDLLRPLFAEGNARPVFTYVYTPCWGDERYVCLRYVNFCPGISHGAQHAAPVCVRAEHRRLDKGRADHAFRHCAGGFLILCAADLADHQFGCTLAVARHFPRNTDEEGGKHLCKQRKILVLRDDLPVLRLARGHDAGHIVGRRIAVDTEHIEAVRHRRRQRFLEHRGGDRHVRRNKAEHGRHIGMDHAGAF